MIYYLCLCVLAVFGVSEALLGAEIVDFNTAAYHPKVLLNSTHICGATAISESWLLTSARCVQGLQPGWLQLMTPASVSTTWTIAEIIPHPDFDLYAMRNDIALLRFAVPLGANSAIRPVEIVPVNYEVPPTALAFITGYGPASLWASLRGVEASVVSHEDCALQYYQLDLSDSVICARIAAAGVSLEQGDGGGALVSRGRAVGVASVYMARQDAVYTKLSAPHIRSFIQTHTAI